jgi:hypothetical protein
MYRAEVATTTSCITVNSSTMLMIVNTTQLKLLTIRPSNVLITGHRFPALLGFLYRFLAAQHYFTIITHLSQTYVYSVMRCSECTPVNCNLTELLLLFPYLTTERRGRVVNTIASYSGGPGFKSWPGGRLS